MDPSLAALLSVILIASNAFFVVAEYTLVASRRSRVEALAQKGSKTAQLLLLTLDQTHKFVAGIQVGITACGLALGALTEPLFAKLLNQIFGTWLPPSISILVSLIIVTYLFVVIGELIPKYVSLANPERLALFIVRPLRIIIFIFGPLAWLTQTTASTIVKPLGLDISKAKDSTISREELALLVRAGETEGMLEESHASVVSKALRFDKLDAADIMIHRLDIKWIDVNCSREEALDQCTAIPHSRVIVCNGDVDDVVGVLYIQDLLKARNDQAFSLKNLLRPLEAVPENLTLNRIVNQMRAARTQILLVTDEYGGTSGLITLEDVIEEVFGEIEDQLESERPPIERAASNRLSARADVRYDEILDYLELPTEDDITTDTLATMLINSLERMPKLGDAVQIPIGTLIVENMARQRITRVRLILSPELFPTGTAL